jgi:hypothetical protein
MKIYHYSKKTGEFVSEGDARPDPKEKGRFLIPAGATDKKPMPAPPNKTPVYDNGWSLVDDYRGEVFFDPNGAEKKIETIGKVDPSWSKTDPKAKEKSDKIEADKRKDELAELKAKAEKAEMMKLIDIETGTTPEAIQYRNQRDNP